MPQTTDSFDHSKPAKQKADERVKSPPPESPLAHKTADPEHREPPVPGRPDLEEPKAGDDRYCSKCGARLEVDAETGKPLTRAAR